MCAQAASYFVVGHSVVFNLVIPLAFERGSLYLPGRGFRTPGVRWGGERCWPWYFINISIPRHELKRSEGKNLFGHCLRRVEGAGL